MASCDQWVELESLVDRPEPLLPRAASFDNLSSADLAEFAKLFKPSEMDLLSFGANGFIAAGFDGADESPGVITNGLVIRLNFGAFFGSLGGGVLLTSAVVSPCGGSSFTVTSSAAIAVSSAGSAAVLPAADLSWDSS